MKRKRNLQIYLILLLPLLIFTLYLFKKESAEALLASADYLSEHSIFEDITFSSQGAYLQQINLYKDDDSDPYHAYIPTSAESPLRIYYTHCESIIFNGEELSSGDLLPSLTPDTPYLIQAANENLEIFAEDYITFYFSGTIPTVYITTESGSMEQINTDKEHKESASYAVYTTDGALDSVGRCSIKGRGNSSWSARRKPYNINLIDDASVLGMDNSSAWALLGNPGDWLPQLRNKAVFELARYLNLPFTPQSEFVQLYLNGQYNGIYLLTQRISVNDGSVKLNDLDAANQQINSNNDYHGTFSHTTNGKLKEKGVLLANTPNNISGGYLLEFDARYYYEQSYFTTPKQKVVIKSPNEASLQQVTYIADYVREAENAVFSDNGINETTGKSYSDYIDIDSWAKIYALQNYFVQWDVEFSSFYIYKENNDPLLYAGPVWDFDLSCGEMYYGYYPKLSQQLLWLNDTQSIWLHQLSKHRDFSAYTVKQYLNELSPAISEFLSNDFSEITAPLIPAFKMHAVRWGKDEDDLEKELNKLNTWMTERQLFLDDYYKNSDLYYSVTFEFPWKSVIYYVKKDTPLSFLPSEKYGETAANLDIFGYAQIIGWQNESGNEVTAEEIITQNVTYYPIYQSEE